MNLPNFLTFLRIILSPVFFFVFFSLTQFENKFFILIILWCIFVIIELSDLLDGHFARKLNKTSNLGKLLDPFADSLSRLTYFVCFASAGIMPFWILLILIYRDLSVSFIRIIMSQKGITMGARLSGKIKAWIYAIAGIGGMLRMSQLQLALEGHFLFIIFVDIVFILSALIALISLLDYLRPLFKK